MTPRLAGLFLPLTTPFAPDGAPDPARLAAQIAIYVELGVDGIVLFGTTGEGPMLSDDEEPELLAAARAALPAGRPLLVQVGRESTRAASAAAERAARAGADALLALPPRYYPVDRAGLAAYYRAVREAGGLPLLAYHIPQRSHVDLPLDLLAELAAEGIIAGIKDSAGDLELQAGLRRAAGPGFAILVGKAAALAAGMAGGADGGILAVADAAPEAARVALDAAAAGDPQADEAQAALLPLAEAIGPRFGIAGIKTAIDLRGWPGGGPPRPPLAPLDEAGRAVVAAALRRAGVAVS